MLPSYQSCPSCRAGNGTGKCTCFEPELLDEPPKDTILQLNTHIKKLKAKVRRLNKLVKLSHQFISSLPSNPYGYWECYERAMK